MSQFLGLAIFLLIAASFAIHAEVELPWFVEWVGHLPGDLLIKKKGITLYVPLTSCLLVSAVVSFFLSLFSKK